MGAYERYNRRKRFPIIWFTVARAANDRPYGVVYTDRIDTVRRVVPQGTFSCGVAAIHLVAPYVIPSSLLYARAAFAGMDKKKTACSHRRFSLIYF